MTFTQTCAQVRPSQVSRMAVSRLAWKSALCLSLLSLQFGPAPNVQAQEQPAAAPAEAPAPVPAPTEFIPYVRLSDESIQQALKLSDEQKAKISELLTKRSESAAVATAEERDGILAQSDAELSAVLNDEQRALFSKLVELKLRFNFKYQRWSDVLEWFAEQAGLSLVMDAPPPGTCNYSDRGDYTIAESIDLMNSLLSNKDFTLIRRGRMLMVVDLSEGIPENLVPRVAVDQLEKHGKFELVSVMIPLGKRNAQEVNAEVKPLLGPHGTSVPLPKTNQILISGQVNSILEIQKIINSIPEPKPPAKKKDPPPPPKPELQTHEIAGFDANAAAETIKQLVSGINVVVDSEASRLNVYATPDQHKAVVAILEKLKTDHTEKKKSSLEIYALDGEPNPELIPTLNLAIPGAQIRQDTAENKLIVFATQEEHKQLKETLAKLDAGGTPQKQNRQVLVYRLKEVDLNAALQLLKQVTPQARATADTRQNAIIAIATSDDHRVIKSVLKELEEGPEEEESLQTYELKEEPSATLMSTLQRMAPKATITPEGKRLVVVAMADEQEKIKATIDKFSTLTKEPSKNLVIYDVTKPQQKRLQAIVSNITAELPGLQIVDSAKQGEISVWALEEQHKIFASILEDLKKEGEKSESNVINSHELQTSNPSNVISLLQSLFPDTRILLDTPANRLLVWTTEEEQAEIAAALSKIDSPPLQKQKLEFYNIGELESATVITNLQQLLPNIRLSWDADTEQLLAVAEAKDHQQLTETLEKWKSSKSAKPNKQIEVFNLERAEPASIISLLQGLFKKTTFQSSPHTRGIIAIGVTEDMAAIKAVVEQLDQEQPETDAEELKFYPVDKKLPSNLLTLLSQMVPSAKVSHDSENNRLTVIAKAKDQAKVAANLVKLMEGTAPEAEKTLKTYAISSVQRRRFETLLPSLQSDLPGIQILAESTPGELSIWAKADQHEKLAGIIEQLKTDIAEGAKPQLISYKLNTADPNETMSVLQTLFPDTKFVVESRSRSLLAWTRPAQQEILKAAIEQIDSGEPGDFTQSFVILPLRKVNSSIVLPMLQEVAPHAKITHDSVANTIIVIGDKETQELVKQTLEKLQTETEAAAEADKRTSKVYSGLEDYDVRDLTRLLRDVVPEARIEGDRDSGTIAAVASETEHELINEMLNQFKEKAATEGKKETVQLHFKKIGARDARAVLRSLFPRAQYTDTNDNKTLVVVAKSKDLEAMKKLAAELDTQAPDSQETVKVYPLESVYASTAGGSLRFTFPQLKFTYGADPYKLIVWADADQHTQISDILKKLDEEASQSSGSEMKVYKLDKVTANIVSPVIQAAVPRARFAPNSDNNRLIIWATAKAHEAIAKIVAKLEEQGPPDSDSELRVYKLETNLNSAVTPVIQNAVPGVRFMYTTDAYRMLIFATPAQHEKIQTIVEKVEAENKGTYGGELKIYTLKKITPPVAQSIVQAAIPNLRFGSAPKADQMVIWATQTAHAEVQKILDVLEAEGPPEEGTSMEVYRLQATNSSSITPIIQSEVQGARLLYSPDPYKIIIHATVAQHEKIKAIVDKLEAEQTATNSGTMKVYKIEGIPASTIQSIVLSALPSVKFGPSPDGYKMVTWAATEQHEKIQEIVKELEEQAAADSDAELVIYDVTNSGTSQAYNIIATSVPGVRVTQSSDPTKIYIWGTKTIHEKVKKIVDKLESEEMQQKNAIVRVYAVENLPAGTIQQIIQAIVPTIRFGSSPDGYKVVVWGTPKQHELAQQAIDELTKGAVLDSTSKLVVYDVSNTGANYAIGIIRSMVMNVKVSTSSDPSKLLVWGTEAVHSKVKKIVDDMEAEGTGNNLEVYTLDSTGANYMYQVIANAVPGIRVNVTADPRKLAVWGTPTMHEKVKEIVAKLEAEGPVSKDSFVETYLFNNIPATSAINVLQMSIPQARYTTTTDTRKLIVWAKPSDHKGIKAIVDKLDQDLGVDDARDLAVIPLNGVSHSTLLQFLKPELKVNANFTPNTATDNLIVQAPQAQMELLTTTINELIEKLPKDEKPISKSYVFKHGDPSAAYSILYTLVPTARIAVDNRTRSIVVSAVPDDHKKIEEAVAELDVKELGENAPALKKYVLKNVDPYNMQSMLQTLFATRPEVRFSIDINTKTLVAYAKPDQQKEIAEFVADVDQAGSGLISKVFKLKNIDPYTTSSVIRGVLPRNTIIPDPATKTLTVVGTSADHAKVAETLEQLDQNETASISKVYKLKNISANSAFSIIRGILPRNTLVPDQTSRTLTVVGTADEQIKVAATLEQVDQENTSQISTVYSLQNADPYSAMNVIRGMLPQNVVVPDRQSRTLTVVATEAEHLKIASAIKEFDKVNPSQISKVFNLKHINANSAYNIIYRMLPRATVVADPTTKTLTVVGNEAEHAKAAATLAQIDQKNADTDRIMKSYSVKSVDPSVLYSMMSNLFNRRSDAYFTYDRVGGSVIANAPQDVHDEIAKAIAEIEKTGGTFSTRAFQSKKIAPASLQRMLQSQFPNQTGVRITFDQQSGMVMAYGPTQKLESIQAAIEELEKSVVHKVAHVYHLEESDARSAYTIMQTLVPNAKVAPDRRNNTLVVEATPEDHEIVAQLVQQMEHSKPHKKDDKVSRAYQVNGISTSGLFQMVRDIFRDDWGVKVSRDNESETVIVRAKPSDHEKVDNLIEALKQTSGERETTIYRLENADTGSAVTALRSASPKSDIAVDRDNNSLIVTASTSEQARIKKIIDELDFDYDSDRTLEVFQLRVNEAYAAEMAIENMFGNSVWDDNPSSPLIDSDMNNQQLFIRASDKKLEKIRDLLIKMGETHLAETDTAPQKGNLRVIPFRGNTRDALKEIERIWPQLRKNQIKVVVPSAVAPTLRKFRRPAENGTNFSVEDEVPASEEKAEEPATEQPEPEVPHTVKKVDEQAQEELPPVIISVKDDRIMISSDDTEALDQLESLLRALTRGEPPKSKFGREFVVFSLQNASAREVAQTLNKVFGRNNRSRRGGGRSSSYSTQQLAIESDERLNAIIVYGNSKEREMIEELLQVLDSEETNELLEQNRPKVIPVKNTSAIKIESVLRDVYRAEMRSAGGARPIPVPTGVSREVAATIQQINVQMAGPLLQVSIDQDTNSLILSGSQTILEQVEGLIAELDEKAKTESSQTFRVVPLKKINSSRAREVLRELFPQNSRRSGRSRRRRGN